MKKYSGCNDKAGIWKHFQAAVLAGFFYCDDEKEIHMAHFAWLTIACSCWLSVLKYEYVIGLQFQYTDISLFLLLL